MKETLLKVVLQGYEDRIGGRFKPDNRFYKKVKINQKRFGQLVRGEKPIFGFEARNLAMFFEVPLESLL
ncbi:hypothetical protein LX87_02493 [Larkinella arboricola]|uniref:HTH cro/C1-type domain-containing protein n=1 Tax=Larkinella arboricola TaxID=643671 RepID=A0A327WYG7_LARAB|nr:hypothetical protein [Larkinella arboricola]RAJ97590.1 hypothetical protein LX87_02493 [Larkinella arboricola]